MKNKVVLFGLIAMLAGCLTACGESKTEVNTNLVVEEDINISDGDTDSKVDESAEVISKIESTETVVEEATENPTEEVVEEVAESKTEVITEEPTEEIKSESEESPAYTFVDMDAIKYAKSNVNVRNLPNKMGDKLGGLSQNEEIHITGKCNETGWYRFEYKGDVAYVSNEYIVDEKVVAAPPAETPSNGGGNNSGGSNNNSGGITWGDGERTYANAKSYFASIGYPICTVFWNGDGTFSFYFLGGQANANGDNVYDNYDMCAANGIHGYTGTGPGQYLGCWTINGGDYTLDYITATPNSLD